MAETRQRFLGTRGVVLRLWECSLVGCFGGGNRHSPVDDPFLQNCVRHEVRYGAAQSPPASLLRWDVPAAIFAGGRCVEPAGTEWELYPRPAANADPLQRMDRDGWQPSGFVGHNATHMGVGWVLGDLPRVQREAAFAHDAWTASSHKSGTWEGASIAACQKQPNATRWQPTGPGGREYAKARYLAMHAPSPRRRRLAPLQQMAAAFKWGVANSTLNCFHWRWEEALSEQRAYALHLQARVVKRRHKGLSQVTDELRPECSIWDSLYNQVHVSYNLSNIRAIFYVNDTNTARWLPKFNCTMSDLTTNRTIEHRRVAWQRLKQRLHDSALQAADAAFRRARAAQRFIEADHGVTLPILQYFFTADCFRGERLAMRLRLANQARRGGVWPNADELASGRTRGDAGWTARAVFR